MQNSKHLRYCQALKYSLHKILCNLDIFTTNSSPNILKTEVYEGPFSTDLCVILTYPEFEAYSEPSQISIMVNFIQNHA